MEILESARSGAIELTLSSRVPAKTRPQESESLKLVEFQSSALTGFWGRPIMMRAVVALPPNDAAASAGEVPALYHVHDFGGTISLACFGGLQSALRGSETNPFRPEKPPTSLGT